MFLILFQVTPTPIPAPSLVPVSHLSDPITAATLVIAAATVVYSLLTFFLTHDDHKEHCTDAKDI